MIYEIKKHKVSHGDIMDGLRVMSAGEKAHIFYSDPPWGQGNLKYWQTINKKMTGAQPKEMNLDLFLKNIFNIAKQNTAKDGVVFIEYGQRWKAEILEYAKNVGLVHCDTTQTLYGGTSKKRFPLDLHVFAHQKIEMPKGYKEAVENTHGYNTLVQAATKFKKEGGIVLDPCCGMGYSAKLAVELNMVFRGNELNSERLKKTIKKLEK